MNLFEADYRCWRSLWLAHGAAQALDLSGTEGAEASRFHVELQRPVAYAFDFLYAMADALEHAVDLAVASFDERDFIPGVRGIVGEADLRRSGFRAAALHARGDGNSAAQFGQAGLLRLAADLDEICFRHMGGGAGELVGQLAVVGHQQQTFTRPIESADRINALVDGYLASSQQVHNRRTPFRVADRGDVAFGLVEHQIGFTRTAVRRKTFAIDLDVVMRRVGFAAQFGDRFSIHRNTSGCDQLLGFAAGAQTGGSD